CPTSTSACSFTRSFRRPTPPRRWKRSAPSWSTAPAIPRRRWTRSPTSWRSRPGCAPWVCGAWRPALTASPSSSAARSASTPSASPSSSPGSRTASASPPTSSSSPASPATSPRLASSTRPTAWSTKLQHVGPRRCGMRIGTREDAPRKAMSRRFGFQVVLASALVLAACSEEKKPQQPPPPDPPEAHVKIADPTSGPYPIGQRIVVDGRESKGEGELEYRWTLHVPEGSQAEFEFENRDRNAFTPDTGGTYV